MALNPSPTPQLIITPLLPQAYALLKIIPDSVWNALWGALILAIVRYFLDMRQDRQKQTLKATMLELFSQFAEKNNEALRKAFLDSQRQASENMIEIVKLERLTERSVEQLENFEPNIKLIITKLEDHSQRIWKLEQRGLNG